MTLFSPIPSTLVNAQMIYKPGGYELDPAYVPTPQIGSTLILCPGDTVTILSVWTRSYLAPGAPLLYHVFSHNTGRSTHVTMDDLVAAV